MVQNDNFFQLETYTLSFDAQKTRFRSLEKWFKSPQGIDIGNFFASELTRLNEFLYGETIVQLGGSLAWMKTLHYIHKWHASPYLKPSSTLLTSFNQLPFQKEAVDCVIAPLVLEAFSGEKNPIDEIDRVIKPMGYVVFFGINPISLWGLSIRLKQFSCYGPLTAKPKSVFFLKRAMLHRGYIQCHLSTFYYIPPVSTRKCLDKLEILNELGKMISPCPSGFYCLVMQKQQEIHPSLLFQDIEEEAWFQKKGFQPICQFKPK